MSTTEMIMSTIVLRAAGTLASVREPKLGAGLAQRLLAAGESPAKQRVLGFLAAMDDDRLLGLGFTAADIGALRSGRPAA